MSGVRYRDYCYGDIADLGRAVLADGIEGVLLSGVEAAFGVQVWFAGSYTVPIDGVVVEFGGSAPAPARVMTFPECSSVGPIRPEWDVNPELLELGFIAVLSLWGIGLGVGLIISVMRKMRNT